MWAAARLGILAFLIAASSAAAGGGVSALLDPESAAPWRGVGRVNILDRAGRGMCTGTLVQPDVVLTAAHCVTARGTGRMIAVDRIHFVAGWRQGKHTGHRKALTVVRHPDWKPNGIRNTAGDVANDLALILLETPMTSDEATPFPVARAPLPGETVYLIGYRRDRPHALTRQDNCVYEAIDGAVLVLKCAIVRGTSGAPVFALIGGRPRLVAVVSAKSERGSPHAYAGRAELALPLMMRLLRGE